MVAIFWNLCKRDINAHVASVANENNVDLLILAECATPIAGLLETLNATEVRWEYAPTFGSNTVIFVRGSHGFLTPLYDLPRMSVRRVHFPGRVPFHLASVHLSSLLWKTEDDQYSEARELIDALKGIEDASGHSRTVVMGDFNMDPFSKGLTGADAWNAVRTRDIAGKGSRMVNNRDYGYFFNPMWRLLTDGSMQPSGTYFYSPSGYPSLHWRIFDQVLVRPVLMENLAPDAVAILYGCGLGSLAGANGRPKASDHFPLKLTLDF